MEMMKFVANEGEVPRGYDELKEIRCKLHDQVMKYSYSTGMVAGNSVNYYEHENHQIGIVWYGDRYVMVLSGLIMELGNYDVVLAKKEDYGGSELENNLMMIWCNRCKLAVGWRGCLVIHGDNRTCMTCASCRMYLGYMVEVKE